MKTINLADLALAAGGTAHGDAQTMVGPDVVIDARQATPGCLFVAIPGDRVDGHDFAEQARERGASAVLGTRVTDADLAHVVVDESVAGLSRLAHHVVDEAVRDHSLTVIAITGSSGKTSTKDVLAQVLEHAGPTVSPIGSFNNEIGVPLTACKVDAETRFLVSEMGARGIGHLRWLTGIVAPSVSVVLNVGTAHLGEFGSAENIAIAKGELVEAVDADGWAVLNADDARVAAMASRTPARRAWFTRGNDMIEGDLVVRAASVRADDLDQHAFTLVVERPGRPRDEFGVRLQLMGDHQVSNALAAAAAAIAAGVEPEAVAASLNAVTHRSKWRMELQVRDDGAAILNDSYNANPDSMTAALQSLAHLAAARRGADPGARAIAVLGEMLELGEQSETEHEEIGRRAARLGIDELIAVDEPAGTAAATALARGAAAEGISARVCAKADVAATLVVRPRDVVLVKASRGVALDEVAADLLAAQQTAAGRGAGSDDGGEQTC